jgi:hypothetical protein
MIYLESLDILTGQEKKDLVYSSVKYIIDHSGVPQAQLSTIDTIIENYIAIDQGIVNINKATNGCSCCKVQ